VVDDKGQGNVETSDGTIPRGQLLKAFDNRKKSAIPLECDHPEGIDDHVVMMNKNIKGHLPDCPKSGRDIRIKALKEYHETVTNAPTSPVSQSTVDDNDATSLASLRSDRLAETRAYKDMGETSQRTMNCSEGLSPKFDPGIASRIQDGTMTGLVHIELDFGNDSDDAAGATKLGSMLERSLVLD
jgi:hypothetical protein